MPLVDRKYLLLVLGCLFSAAASASKSNATNPRTFVIRRYPSTDEPIDIPTYEGDDDDEQLNPRPNRTVLNGTESRFGLSDQARLFLTGPVSTILMPSFYTLVCCISVPINFGAVMAFALGIRPKKPAAIFMLNLASADLLFGLTLPFKIIYHFEGNDWIFGSLLCRVVTGGFYWNMYCSVLLIACISVDRFLAVVYPIDSLAWRRPKNTIIACVAMWVLSFAASLPLVVSDQTVHLEELNITTCHDVQYHDENFWLHTYFIVIFFSLFLLPFIVTVGSYAKVIWRLSSVPRGLPGSSRKKTRAVVMALTVLMIFVLCFMPTNCFLLAHYWLFKGLEDVREAPDGSYGFYLMFLCLGSLNCLLDPLAYYFGSSQCQRQLSRMLKCRRSTEKGSITHSSSDSCRSSTRPILKHRHTESSKITSSVTKTDSLEANLDSQYNKLLV
ncbi:proteinase-activated receptor 1 [Fundulus heteroclitus]|uniref:proteinase-activated receptor 1 n=1 Tax=Fundulus heteroclitus TaxID=8078 RepID=UPI00165C7AB5|nr:proteinase-activated receptor 1 [Fundulus heteroclitus]